MMEMTVQEQHCATLDYRSDFGSRYVLYVGWLWRSATCGFAFAAG